MGWCGSSMPGTPEFQTMNEEGHKCEKSILANDCVSPIIKRTPKGCPF
uniref:ORF47k n=1 Tax=Pinus koraiensis TaxID=88728 RepID=Q85WT2_PINKO|nr:ORF47k [Pinus koraiensis]AAO74137.1 ORF47k [Pinus koraiensis]